MDFSNVSESGNPLTRAPATASWALGVGAGAFGQGLTFAASPKAVAPALMRIISKSPAFHGESHTCHDGDGGRSRAPVEAQAQERLAVQPDELL